MPSFEKKEPENQYVDFWEGRYQTGQLTWDLNGPAPYFEHLLRENPDAFLSGKMPGKMIVPGCGRGHDAALFAKHGFQVMAFDYAPGAIAAAQALYGNENPVFIAADMFDLDPQYNHAFDYVLEHTCFCAINPRRRNDYVQVAHRLLKPGGMLLGIFWDIDDPDGPPFGVSEAALLDYFQPYFDFKTVIEIPAEYRLRQGGTEFFAGMRALPL